MSVPPISNLSRLCIHTITTKPWNIETAAKHFSAAGVTGITVWRQALEGRSVQATGEMLRSEGLEIVSLCRGGFFPHLDQGERARAIDENKKAIDEAATLGTNLLVLVCGAEPRQPLEDSRKQIQEAIETLLPHAAQAGVKLAIEPLHPMYADTRSAVNTLSQANAMAEAIDSPWVGVAVDVYHLWWDPSLETQIKRCGEHGNLFAFHVCDWNVPTIDMLNDRGLMGEGCIPVPRIRQWVDNAGFTGYHEVEIFSEKFWKEDQSVFLEKIINAYKTST